MSKKWITLFSQTGSEIVELSKDLGYWPDRIITNKRPEHLRKINNTIPKDRLLVLPNKPTINDYIKAIGEPENVLITLHGWLRIIPPSLCNDYSIVNGHPGLISKFDHLKGKDPQVRAFDDIKNGKYSIAGCVLHLVTEGVDEGKILDQEFFNADFLEFPEFMRILRDRSLYLWTRFLKKHL